MGDIFFSIIIPVYRVERYLHECVDSVLAQSFRDFEVILVDDGSPDRCPGICDAYAENDSRVRVIHKENGGLSDARNAGVRQARGEYLMFLDSDDYWDDPDALKKIHLEITGSGAGADIVIFQAKLLYPDGSMIPDSGRFPAEFNAMDPEEALRFMSGKGLLIGSACSKVIKRSFFLANDLFFKVGLKSEDIDWIIRAADCLPRYLYADQYFYIYRKGRSESITANVDAQYLSQFADMLEGFAGEYHFANETTRECLLSLVAYEYIILAAKTANLADGRKRKQLLGRIKKLRHILDYDMHPKVRRIRKMQRIIGFAPVVFLLGFYLKHRKR
ncbi:MAG: glycosyltransferase [Oscillospiraceae bacterium]|nr:glycosyltransferase [Oscillospiraceae bacterium]